MENNARGKYKKKYEMDFIFSLEYVYNLWCLKNEDFKIN